MSNTGHSAPSRRNHPAVQRRGPYFLGGWCVDGVVAYEIAQQLRAAGELVALLGLFDPSVEVDIDSLSCVASALIKFRKIAGTSRIIFGLLLLNRLRPNIMHYASRHSAPDRRASA